MGADPSQFLELDKITSVLKMAAPTPIATILARSFSIPTLVAGYCCPPHRGSIRHYNRRQHRGDYWFEPEISKPVIISKRARATGRST